MFQNTNQMCVFLKHSDCTIGINWTRGILEERSIKKSPLVNVNSLRTGKSSSIIYKFGKSTNFLWAMASMSQSVSLYQRVNPIRSLLNHHKITIYSGKITIFLWFSYSGVPPLFSFSPPPWPVENGHAKPGPWKEGEKCQDPTRGSHQQLNVPSNMEGTKHFTYDKMVHCHLYMIQWFAYIKTTRGVYIYIIVLYMIYRLKTEDRTW